MYAKYSQVTGQTAILSQHNDNAANYCCQTKNPQKKLKPYHHIRLDSEFKSDCKVWLQFLCDDKLHQIVSRPMIDTLGQAATSDEIRFYLDASGSKK